MNLVCGIDRLRAVLEPIHPTADAAERLLAYLQVLDRWAARQRLVGWRTAEDLLQEGLRDAWSAVPLLGGDAPILDVGSGAGLPGLIFAAALPDRTVHLVEARRKRASFLREAIRAMGLSATSVHHGRADELVRAGAFHPKGALLTSRAFARPGDVLDLGARWEVAATLVTSSRARLPEAPPEGWAESNRRRSRPDADSFHVLYTRDVGRIA